MTTEPLLDLAEGAPPQAWIRGADGNRHDLCNLDDLSLNDRRALTVGWERVNAIAAKTADITAAEEREYDATYTRLVRLIVPSLKAREVKEMGRERREAVVQAFFTYRMHHQLIQRLMAASPSETGSPSSPSSPTTTDEPPSEAATGEMSP